MRVHELISESTNFPVKSFDRLFHVGTMNVTRKRTGSYEGSGLSVSTNPDAWRKIGRGHVTGDTWVLTKPGNRFLLAHKISASMLKQIMQWAVTNKLIEPAEIVRVSYYDDELENTVHSDFSSIDAAKKEYDNLDDYDVSTHQSYRATDKLRSLSNNPRIEHTGIQDYVLPIWAEANGLDGVWWQDTLDVSRFSAPRGVIVPNKVSSWTAERQQQ